MNPSVWAHFSCGFVVGVRGALMICTVLVAVVIGFYHHAVRVVEQQDLAAAAFLPGTTIYERPYTVALGQPLQLSDVIARLAAAGYVAASTGVLDRGTYRFTDDTVEIRPWLRAFPNVSITIVGGRVTQLFADGAKVASAQLEPRQISTIVRTESGHESRHVRRYPVAQATIVGSRLADAIISAEDAQFANHRGISYWHLSRATVGHLAAALLGRRGSDQRGGSTLTQQMVRNAVVVEQARTYRRKLRETFLAAAVEAHFDKGEILTAYANAVYLGDCVEEQVALYGVAAAAEELFGVRDVRRLDLASAATLAAMLNRPAFYAAAARRGDYAALASRRDWVLSRMALRYPVRYPEDVVAAARRAPVRLAFAHPVRRADARYFANHVADALQPLRARGVVDESPLHVFTTLDLDLQAAAEAAVNEGLVVEPALQAALVAVDTRSGELLSYVGGRDFATSRFDRAGRARRSPASAIKPFVYASALASGSHAGRPFTAATVLDPVHDAVPDSYRPTEIGTAGRVRVQLARSENGSAVVALHDVGLAPGLRFLTEAIGVVPKATGMAAIGGSEGTEVSPLELALGYALFPRGGRTLRPRPVALLVQHGRALSLASPDSRAVLDPAPAYVATELLRSVVGDGIDGGQGTAREARVLAGLDARVDLAGKTGTGQRADLWFVGFTPRLVVAVWVGRDDNRHLALADGFTGARWALPIWAGFIREVARRRADLLEGEFEMPAGVEQLPIDPLLGCVRPGGLPEYFVVGRRPDRCR